MNAGPQTQVDEIAPDVFRMSTCVPDITEHGFTFNQFLLTGDEPLLSFRWRSCVGSNAEVIHGPLACMLSLIDMCDRPPVAPVTC